MGAIRKRYGGSQSKASQAQDDEALRQCEAEAQRLQAAFDWTFVISHLKPLGSA